MIDTILFDLGDTLVNLGIGRAQADDLFEAGARETYEYLTAHHARAGGREGDLPTFAVYRRCHFRAIRNAYLWSKLRCRDFNVEHVIGNVCNRLGINLHPPELHELAWVWYRPVLSKSSVDPGVHAMLERLRATGTRMAIVSNTFVPSHCMDRHLEHEGLLEFFPIRVYSSHTHYRKPHPRIFRIALEQLGAEPKNCVFVGDLLKADVAGARKLGMKTVWKPARSISVAPDARHRADVRIKSIAHLPEVLPALGWKAPRALPADFRPRFRHHHKQVRL
jgi:putative hydrolase of the HAD superfamily